LGMPTGSLIIGAGSGMSLCLSTGTCAL